MSHLRLRRVRLSLLLHSLALALSVVAGACGDAGTVVEHDPFAWTAAPTGPLAERVPGFDVPANPVELGLAGYAKVICSAVFVSGRDPYEAAKNSAFIWLPERQRKRITSLVVDREGREVRVTWASSVTRIARFMGDQGCVVIPRGADGVSFTPVPVVSSLPPADTLPWPMGDALRQDPLPDGIDASLLRAAEDAAFAPEALTAAFVVAHRGRIVAERYAPGITRDTQLESWSMGKSVTATLVGVLVEQGALDPEDPAPVPEWSDDPRSAIRIIDLLRMSSGLLFIAPRDPDYDVALGYPEHMYIYTGGVDIFELALSRPLQFPPNTEGRYRNADPLVLGYLIRETARARGEEYLTFPQRALFDRVGIRRQVLETDPFGNFALTGFDYGTARNWVRLGILYLNDGVFGGERVLPQGWSELVSTPAPAWDEPVYGGQFWLNRTGRFPLPDDAYFMAGAGGQATIVVPSLDLVVVRMGHLRGYAQAGPALETALRLVVKSLP